jgi:hypothetical protein
MRGIPDRETASPAEGASGAQQGESVAGTDQSTGDSLRLHLFTLSDVLAGAAPRSWDQSDCPITLTAEKSKAMASNPAATDLSAPAQLVAVRGKRVVGRIDLLAGELEIDRGKRRTSIPILWGSNLYVPENDRKSMAGAMLVMKTAAIASTVGAHGPSQLALPLYERLGFARIPLDRFILLHSSRSVARRYLGDGLAGLAASALGDLALLGLRGVNAGRSVAAGVRVRRLPQMPTEFDPVLQALPSGHATENVATDAIPTTVRCPRSASWINWILHNEFGRDEPHSRRRHQRALFLVENRRREPLGYLLLKVKFHRKATSREFPDLTLASLCDWGSLDGRPEFRELVTPMALRAAAALNVDALEICLAPSDPLTSRLRSFGFLRAGTMYGMVKANQSSALSAVPFKEAANWALQYGDGDNALS